MGVAAFLCQFFFHSGDGGMKDEGRKWGVFAKQNFKNLANLAKKVNFCKKNQAQDTKGFLTKLARLARFLKF